MPGVPSQACRANNTCVTGYQDVRCASCCNGTITPQCVDGNGRPKKYYRPPNIAQCVPCPDLAWLFILAYVLFALVGAAVFFWLSNKREINFAGVRIAVDYFQVLSMFAGLKVAWPSQVLNLWEIASAANLDPDITVSSIRALGLFWLLFWHVWLWLLLVVVVVVRVWWFCAGVFMFWGFCSGCSNVIVFLHTLAQRHPVVPST